MGDVLMNFIDAEPQAVDAAVARARAALDEALRAPARLITPSIETQVQTALDLLRAEKRDDGLLVEFERIAVTLRSMCQALREGRPNFYASRFLRLRREHLVASSERKD
jgi:hypothetical protein